MNTRLSSVDQILELFFLGSSLGTNALDHDNLDGDRVDLVEHGLQCAELLTEWYPEDLELQVAGLLHDLGHHLALTGSSELREHDEVLHAERGAMLVSGVLGQRVGQLILLHVPAKRFLITYDEDYGAGLSPISVRTLDMQGGPMLIEEAAPYRALPNWTAALALRRADDLAKVPDHPTRALSEWISSMRLLAARHRLAV
jgi:predicted HD phosphohydrolase